MTYGAQDVPDVHVALMPNWLMLNVAGTPAVEQISQPKSIWSMPLPAGM